MCNSKVVGRAGATETLTLKSLKTVILGGLIMHA